MGFYGNITNTSRTTFQFDKIYSSRYEMDKHCSTDGVYNGRYVLVEYDTEIDAGFYKPPYMIVTFDNAGLLPTLYPIGQLDNSQINYFDQPLDTLPITVNEVGSEDKIYWFDTGNVFSLINGQTLFVRFKQKEFQQDLDATEEVASDYEIVSIDDVVNNFDWPLERQEFVNKTLEDIKGLLVLYQDDEVWLQDVGLNKVYIANEELYYHDNADGIDSIFTNADENGYIYGYVRRGRQYSYNVDPEFWKVLISQSYANDGKTYPTLRKVPFYEDIYTQNFNLDKDFYAASRGYDSTVWQKVYVDGIEKYVMIAELNTVVPTFGISSDPPSLLPLNPHWGYDSTNVYYNLHWQPQWSFRVKAANSRLTVPTLNPNGTIFTTEDGAGIPRQNMNGVAYMRDIRKDATIYPSDYDAVLSATFEDRTKDYDRNRETLYYDPETRAWISEVRTTPAAIYFNKDGFDSETIAYSEDLTDKGTRSIYHKRYNEDLDDTGWTNSNIIQITPTGLSGNLYNAHDGTQNQRAQADTQEMSIMLPGIGDVIAQMWDLIYGGRDTSQEILYSNKRNKDIKWEWGTEHLYRLGLRFRGSEGEQANEKALGTIAGCINTAHDLFGMIIKKYDYLDEGQGTEEFPAIRDDTANLLTDRMYFVNNEQKYYRTCTKYTYNKLDHDQYRGVIVDHNLDHLSQEKIHNGIYYIKVDGKYINMGSIDPEPPVQPEDPEADPIPDYSSYYDYDPNQTYYYKVPRDQYELIEVNDDSVNNKIFLKFPANGFLWYKDKDNTLQGEFQCNYIYDSAYHDNKEYYKVDAVEVTLTDRYIPSHYHFKDEDTGNLILDDEPTPTEGRVYYEIHDELITQTIQRSGIDRIYVPGQYYYLGLEDGFYHVDNTRDGSDIKNRNKNAKWGGEHNEGDAEDSICYSLFSTVVDQGPEGNSVVYIRKVYYEQVEKGDDKELNERTYVPGVYYYISGWTSDEPPKPIYSLDRLAYNPSGDYNYYRKVTTYEIDHRDPDESASLESDLDLQNPISIGSMIQYAPDTFYTKIFDTKGNVALYESVTYQTLTKQAEGFLNPDNSLRVPIFVFGKYDEEDRTYSPNKEDIAAWGTENGRVEKYNNHNQFFISFGDELTRDRWRIDHNKEPIVTKLNDFYFADKYHYLDGNSYILDKRNTKAADRYFQITKVTKLGDAEIENGIEQSGPYVRKEPLFYQENSFYYLDGDDYIVIDNSNVDDFLGQNEETNILSQLTNIYRKKAVYVAQDTNNILYQGMEWNMEAKSVPDGVTLATRDESVDVTELKNYAIDTTTINGLILKIEHMLENGDIHTRDTNTVAGALNKVKDIIARFDKIKSREITIIDDAGRVTSASVGTDQSLSYNQTKTRDDVNHTEYYDYIKKDRFPIANDVEHMWNQWITVNVDGNLLNPQVIVHHNFQPVQDTISTLNINDDFDSSTDQEDADTIVLYTPKVDGMGHVVGKDLKTVTLPYAYKYIQTNGTVNRGNGGTISSNVDNLTPSASNEYISANSTFDTLHIDSYHRWIRIKVDSTNNIDKVTIAHELHDITTTAKSDSVLDGVGHFTVQDITYDDAGHLTAVQNHKYTLPYSFRNIVAKAVSSANTSVTTNTNSDTTINADVYNDTLSFVQGNAWITVNASQNSNAQLVTLGHAGAQTATNIVGDAAAQTPTFNSTFKVPYIGIDNAGHVSTLSAHNVTIPGITVTNDTTGGNVITGGSFTNNTNTLTLSTAKLGGLTLSDTYTTGTAAVAIAATDTLNSALGKLEWKADDARTRVGSVENAIEGLDLTTLSVGAGETISSISQTNGQLAASKQTIDITTSQINNLSSYNSFTNYYTKTDLDDTTNGRIKKSDTFSYNSSKNNDAAITTAEAVQRIALLEDIIVQLITAETSFSASEKQGLLDSLEIS